MTNGIEKIVITGGAGFVGSHLTEHICAAYPDARVTVFDKLTYAGDARNLVGLGPRRGVQLIIGDITDRRAAFEALKGADIVIHAAAESHVDNSFEEATVFTNTNVLGTQNLLEACIYHEVGRIIHVSTDEVYGEREIGECSEADVMRPTNPYAATKAAADLLVHAYYKAHGIPVTIVRSNNMYGTRQFPEKIIPRFLCHAIMGWTLPIHGTGLNVRHYLSTRDFCRALELLIEKGDIGQIYNIGSQDVYSNLEIARMICEEVGRDPDQLIDFTEDRPFNDSRYGINCSKIKALGWWQTRHLKDDLAAIAAWYRENMDRYAEFLTSGTRSSNRPSKAGLMRAYQDAETDSRHILFA